jgi:hypothetical protein
MNHADAEEYTQALGQVVAGGWRQVALGQRLGVPAALGISTTQWVEERLGGYVRMSIPERREAVKELTSKTEEGGQGLSNVQAAQVLGVTEPTVRRDRISSNDALVSPHRTYAEQDDASNDEPVPFDLSDLPSPRLTRAELAYTKMGPLLAFVSEDPHDVAATCAPEDLEDKAHVIGGLARWIGAVYEAIEERRHPAFASIQGGRV